MTGSVAPLAALVAFVTAALVAVFAAGACDGQGGGGSGGAGTGGAAPCPTGLEAMFTVTVRAPGGPVPPDTTVHVAWSAAEEPTFVLNDPSTWKTIEEANLVCAVDRERPPPEALSELVCALWTAGVTRLEISGTGYEDFEQTLTPVMSEECEGFLPQKVDIELVPAVDGGVAE
ncbi:hypothetical protein SOCE26_072750 [Sorangium cellulosum]|uniref:Secreted protein n=1 Tax=Sorangium cellulosum TaxID=56 RepID=A0A2L0F2U0_SORCE|nr:hypothetical protein [Sorangium cellulosum]AUX45779.1 hypothetical protein SOCE26_072750 [Sorangium cellulosum]